MNMVWRSLRVLEHFTGFCLFLGEGFEIAVDDGNSQKDTSSYKSDKWKG